VVCGAVAMLSPKRQGRHPWFGSVYFWSLAGVFVTASALAAVRWAEDYVLFCLATVSFATAILGRQARRRRWTAWPRWHMTGMGLSYIVMITAFYADNGKSLPVWRDLPPITYWLAPALVGGPILLFTLLRHPLVRAAPSSS
jgi:peptidoglycan/LPS O-acetylase OafA/YrhL